MHFWVVKHRKTPFCIDIGRGLGSILGRIREPDFRSVRIFTRKWKIFRCDGICAEFRPRISAQFDFGAIHPAHDHSPPDDCQDLDRVEGGRSPDGIRFGSARIRFAPQSGANCGNVRENRANGKRNGGNIFQDGFFIRKNEGSRDGPRRGQGQGQLIGLGGLSLNDIN